MYVCVWDSRRFTKRLGFFTLFLKNVIERVRDNLYIDMEESLISFLCLQTCVYYSDVYYLYIYLLLRFNVTGKFSNSTFVVYDKLYIRRLCVPRREKSLPFN